MRMVCRLEAQKRFTVVPGTVSGKPASSAARRARFIPCLSCGKPQPTITSTISPRSSSGAFFKAASIAYATRSSGRASTSEPLPARPIGVRAAATMTASGIGSPGSHVHDLADERRLLLALDLDLDADVPDHARPTPLCLEQLRVRAHARADRHGAREADLLRAVVDAHHRIAQDRKSTRLNSSH